MPLPRRSPGCSRLFARILLVKPSIFLEAAAAAVVVVVVKQFLPVPVVLFPPEAQPRTQEEKGGVFLSINAPADDSRGPFSRPATGEVAATVRCCHIVARVS